MSRSDGNALGGHHSDRAVPSTTAIISEQPYRGRDLNDETREEEVAALELVGVGVEEDPALALVGGEVVVCVDLRVKEIDEPGVELEVELALTVVEAGTVDDAPGDDMMLVPETTSPFPIVENGVQEDEDGAGCALGVTGSPW